MKVAGMEYLKYHVIVKCVCWCVRERGEKEKKGGGRELELRLLRGTGGMWSKHNKSQCLALD